MIFSLLMERDWNKSKLIGNNAENIVCFLIKSMPDWECIKFGVENHIKDLRKTVKEHINPITKKIKSMPDFVAFNTKTGETFFIEVKYRSRTTNFITNKPAYHINFLEEYKKYWAGTKLIIFQDYEPYIFAVDLDKIEDSMSKKVKGQGSFWNFEEIKRDIKEIFPELKNEVIEESIKRIVPNGGN